MERYELFVIIALGESLISIGLGATAATRHAVLGISILIAVLLIAVKWRVCLVGVRGTGREHRESLNVRRAHRSSRIAHIHLYLLLVTGIILVAADLKVAMADVTTEITPLFGSELAVGLAAANTPDLVFLSLTTAVVILGSWSDLLPASASVPFTRSRRSRREGEPHG